MTQLIRRAMLLVDLNAYYDRTRLDFGHKVIGGQTVYTSESPDIVAHELGHAVLDSIRPVLFDAESDEVAAFHGAFADISAILTTLQLDQFRLSVLEETEGRLQNTSRLFGEQVGAAIRRQRPDTVERDCLRNAANSFFYTDPKELPPSGPAMTLSSAPHSFCRVFTGAFLEVLAGMLRIESKGDNPTTTELHQVVFCAGRMLAAAARDAAFEAAFFGPIAHSMVSYDELEFDGKFRSAIITGFTRKRIFKVGEAFASEITGRRRKPTASVELEELRFDGRRFGLRDCEILVRVPFEDRRDPANKSLVARGWESAAESFLLNLFRRGRVGLGDIELSLAGDVVRPPAFLEAPRSHELKIANSKTSQVLLARIIRGFSNTLQTGPEYPFSRRGMGPPLSKCPTRRASAKCDLSRRRIADGSRCHDRHIHQNQTNLAVH